MNLIIIRKDTPSIQYIIKNLTSDTLHIIHNIYDSIDSLIDKINTKCKNNNIQNIGYLSINDYSQYFYISKSNKCILDDCEIKDYQLSSWDSLCEFISFMKNNYQIVNFDLLTCNIFNNKNWIYVISKLSDKLNINIRSSVNITGIGGDWILESHNINLIGIYFLEKINEYNYSLDNNYNLNLITYNNSIYLSGNDKGNFIGNQNSIFKMCDIKNINVKDFTVGVDYSIILSNDNKLYSIGANDFGQLGDGTIINKYSIIEMDKTSLGNENIDKVISSGFSTYILSNNNIYSCGSNIYGQLGTADEFDSYVLGKIKINMLNGETINKIDAGQNFFIVLTSNNKLFSCGYNYYGQLGYGDFNDKDILTEMNLSNLNNVYPIDFKCGDNYTIVLANDYSIYSCGLNQYGQLGIGNKINQNILVKMNLTNLTSLPQQISCGTVHTAILTSNNEIYFCGYNGYGQFGNDQTLNDNLIPIKTNLNNIMPNKISCGGFHTIIKTVDNKLYSTGSNFYGQLGINYNINKTSFTEIDSEYLDISNNTILNAKYDNTFILSNTLYSCGYNNQSNNINNDYLSFGNTNLYKNNNDKIKLLKYGKNFVVVLTENNKLYTSGLNSSGQLGIGTNIDSNILNLLNEISITIFPQTYPIDIACGEEHFVILTNDNKIYGCGKNNYGQLGQPLTIYNKNTLIRITNFNNVKQISCGSYSTVFLTYDNIIYSLGLNNYGQFGSGNNNNSFTPIPMLTENFIPQKVICGGYHTIIITNDFKLYSCGLNNYGQLGNGLNINTNIPILMNIENFNNHKPISGSCGYYHTCILDNSGNIYTCGLNDNGQLGLNTYLNVSTLSKLNKSLFDYSNIISIYASKNNTFVINNNKVLYSCGDNQNGECGINSPRNFHNNFQKINKPNELLNSTIISAGAYNTYIRNGNIIYGSGSNIYNQLNNFDYLDSDSLINFDTNSLTSISNIIAGNNCLFVISNNKIYTCGKNNVGQLGNGNNQDSYELIPINFQPFINNIPSKIFTFDEHTFVLTQNNKLYASGRNNFGQLGDSSNDDVYQYKEINLNFLNGDLINNISCGKNHSVMLTNDKQIFSCGSNYYGQLGLGNNIDKNAFDKINNSIFNGFNPIQIAAGAYHTLILTDNFNLYGCGLNSSGQLGNNTYINSNLFIHINIANIIPKYICCGYNWSLMLSNDNMLYGCGRNSESLLFDSSCNNILTFKNIPMKLDENEIPINLSAGYYHYVLATNIGNIYTSGSNDFGQTAIERKKNKNVLTICKKEREINNIMSDFIYSKEDSALGFLYIFKNFQNTINLFGLTLNSLIQMIDFKSIVDIGFNLRELYDQNIPLTFMIDNGVTIRQLYDIGISLQEIYLTGRINYFDILSANLTEEELGEFKLIPYSKDKQIIEPYEYYIIFDNSFNINKEILYVNRYQINLNISPNPIPFSSTKLFNDTNMTINYDDFNKYESNPIYIRFLNFKHIFFYTFKYESFGYKILDAILIKYIKPNFLGIFINEYETKTQKMFRSLSFEKQILFYKEFSNYILSENFNHTKLTENEFENIIRLNQTLSTNLYFACEVILYSNALNVGFKYLFNFIIYK